MSIEQFRDADQQPPELHRREPARVRAEHSAQFEPEQRPYPPRQLPDDHRHAASGDWTGAYIKLCSTDLEQLDASGRSVDSHDHRSTAVFASHQKHQKTPPGA
ncbi:MAG: hypothetical protein ACLP01_05405 [Solirubrobacteraceae bacterium]